MSQDAPDVEWKQGEAEEIPLQNEVVDLVFMSQVFHHLVKLPASITGNQSRFNSGRLFGNS